jgi:hypothetical protein
VNARPRLLLDTNILIHREARTVVRDDIGSLFRWIDRLNYVKCVHAASLDEIHRHADPVVARTLGTKLQSYEVLKTQAKDTAAIAALRVDDRTPNDAVDTSLLAEVAAGRVDLLLTEDRGIHRKAARVNLGKSVFTIDSFLEKVTAENPELSDYKVLSVRQAYFGNLDVHDHFFDSFRVDYPGFDEWFCRKAHEIAYICTADSDSRLVAFLYVKRESASEDYSDIAPGMPRKTRLKIGTLKVVSNGYKLGERFLKIVFDNAFLYAADEIYVTIFRKTPEQDRLYRLLEDWGFYRYGKKTGPGGEEDVLVRDMSRVADREDPRRSYPFLSMKARKFIVPIYPEYHTELLPDSILRTESPLDFVENRPNRNAISKVYISRSIERALLPGDAVVFYRTGSGNAPAHYTAVATTVGIVQDVVTDIRSKPDFIQLCRKRSVFSDADLAKYWDFSSNRPFIVNFLYVYSFPTRPNLKELKEAGIISNAPRGFAPLTESAFLKLLEIANANQHFIVD